MSLTGLLWAGLAPKREAVVNAPMQAPTSAVALPVQADPAPLSDLAGATPLALAASGADATMVAVAEPPAPGKAPPRAKAPQARKPSPKTSESAVAVAPVAPLSAKGMVNIAISPWGQVEVNGTPAGTTPPLTRLELPAGTHTVTVRNADFPAYTQRVTVDPDRPASVKHRFGS